MVRLAAMNVSGVCISLLRGHSNAYTRKHFIEKIATSVCARRLTYLSLAGERLVEAGATPEGWVCPLEEGT